MQDAYCPDVKERICTGCTTFRNETVNKLAVMITTPPYSNLSVTALDYIETALKSGVELVGVFFYQDGVLHADAHVQIASDEFQTISQWQKLHQEYKLPLLHKSQSSNLSSSSSVFLPQIQCADPEQHKIPLE